MTDHEIPDDAVKVEFYTDGELAYLVIGEQKFIWESDPDFAPVGWVVFPSAMISADDIRKNATPCATEHEAVTGRVNSGWISVEHRMPQRTEIVVVYEPGAKGSTGPVHMGWTDNKDRWFADFSEPITVTHWQPRPVPPQTPEDQPESTQKAETPFTGPYQPIPWPKDEADKTMAHVACQYSAAGDTYKSGARQCFIQIKDANIASFITNEIIDIGSISNVRILDIIPDEHGPWFKIKGPDGIIDRRTANIGPGLVVEAPGGSVCDAISEGDVIIRHVEKTFDAAGQHREQAEMTRFHRELAKGVKVWLDAGAKSEELYKAGNLFKIALSDLLDAFLKATGQI